MIIFLELKLVYFLRPPRSYNSMKSEALYGIYGYRDIGQKKLRVTGYFC